MGDFTNYVAWIEVDSVPTVSWLASGDVVTLRIGTMALVIAHNALPSFIAGATGAYEENRALRGELLPEPPAWPRTEPRHRLAED